MLNERQKQRYDLEEGLLKEKRNSHSMSYIDFFKNK